MLNSDLIALERAVYRAAREQLSSDNQTEQPDGDAARRDRDAAAVIGPIIDDPAFYHLVPERFIDQTGRIADDAYQEVLRAAINDLYYFGPLEDLLYDESLSEIMVNGPESVWVERSGRLMLTDSCPWSMSGSSTVLVDSRVRANRAVSPRERSIPSFRWRTKKPSTPR